jgi:hypothetical protein
MRIKVSDKRQFDIAIINGEDNPKLANLLNPVVVEFKNKSNLCQSNRGYCYIHSEDFVEWLKENYPVLYKNLSKLSFEGVEIVIGQIQIDHPEKLPLGEEDLYPEEWEDFLTKHGEEYDKLGDDFKKSELIWKWAKKNLDRLDDFYYMSHSWVEIYGTIIDFTWLQFRHAINNKVPLIERYEWY